MKISKLIKFSYSDKEPAPQFGYHGTDVKSLKKIMQEGIKPTKKRTYIDFNFYSGDRAKAIFFSDTFDEAEGWAVHKTGGHYPMAVVKFRFPPKSKVYRDLSERDSRGDFYYIGEIPPSLIVEIKARDPLGDWINLKKYMQQKKLEKSYGR